MTKTHTYMTQEGYKSIKKEYEDLINARPAFVEKLSEATDMGDRSENAAYSNAKRKVRSTDSRLRFLKKVVDFTKIAIPTQNKFVEIGSFVQVLFEEDEFTFQIVGLHEADPLKKKISYKSPVGSALMGRHAGDRVKIKLDEREIEYEVLKIIVK